VQKALPSGTVTFLLTDVEGSTRLLYEIGAEACAEALAQHRRLLREAFAGHGGVEVDTQGDAFFYAVIPPHEQCCGLRSLTADRSAVPKTRTAVRGTDRLAARPPADPSDLRPYRLIRNALCCGYEVVESAHEATGAG
jgi:class 3 adenylate cyclase